jgi:hypothetical protein
VSGRTSRVDVYKRREPLVALGSDLIDLKVLVNTKGNEVNMQRFRNRHNLAVSASIEAPVSLQILDDRSILQRTQSNVRGVSVGWLVSA